MDKLFTDSSPVVENLYISAQGLKGRQSVRATFRLPEEIIQLLGIMARQLGLKQKSLFDQLIEDSEVLCKVSSKMNSPQIPEGRRRQKTYVLSKSSLEILEEVAKKQNIPRDLLVEISIKRLLPVMSAEQKKHRKRVQIYQKMNNLRSQLARLAVEADQKLGEDDQASMLVGDVNDVMAENFSELETLIEKGQAIEEYGEEK